MIAQHAEEPRLTVGAQMHEGVVSARLGLTGWPAAAEEAIIARDVLLAGHVGSRLHVCHVSTAGSVEILRWAKAQGWQVTAEVTPHHLLLTDDLAERYDPVFKVNPPLRTADDVAALRAALADGTIDCVATDHAPHAVEDKETEWGAAASGHARPADGAVGRRSRRWWCRACSTGAAWPSGCQRRSGADRAAWPDTGARSRSGEPANLVLVDPDRTLDGGAAPRWPSKSRNTPFAGRTLPGRVRGDVPAGRPPCSKANSSPVWPPAGNAQASRTRRVPA